MNFRRQIALMLALTGLSVRAAEVHVYERTLAGDVETQLSDTTRETGSTYSTRSAPTKSGYIFTHWSISAGDIDNRDRLGRAKEVASYVLYEETTLTANYLQETLDEDGDGVADGWEIYWYGSLAATPESDTDGDGLTFAEEIAAGLDPLMPDGSFPGGLAHNDGDRLLYNPDNLKPYTIRSEPEGKLFTTITEYVKPGTLVSPSTFSPDSTTFAYWTLDGVRQVDRLGRAVNQVSFTMGETAVELVAVCIDDETQRKLAHWHGPDTPYGADSDIDGDGLTFAEEIAAGLDPLMPDNSFPGGLAHNGGDLLQYNPENIQAYVIRSEPEGSLFSTDSDYAKLGTSKTSGTYSPDSSTFAYWTLNGERVADRLGRAINQVSFTMGKEAVELVAVCESDADLRQQFYWYGKATDMASDTDGDGLTLAEEIAAGLDPLMPDNSFPGGLAHAEGEFHETNLQVYEQVLGAVVDDAYLELFTSPVAGNGSTSMTFAGGAAVWPVVADVDGDGLWDLVVVSEAATSVYLNVGSLGNPEFKASDMAVPPTVDLAMNSTAKLDGMSLDVEPVGALSATTNGATLLVSDEDGRIWYYQKVAQERDPPEFALQHKVWGGSYAGFANGLRLAAVDWDDDGDLDCLCGTAEGKLMLLRDPKVGRPSNLKAQAGVDNVVLTWDPNAQSRIRAYKVYRGPAEGELGNLAQIPLPSYRDEPSVLQPYDYAVSSVSRFYTAGNSTPTVNESPMTAPVRVEFGKVEFSWNDAVGSIGGQVTVTLSIGNTMNLSTNGLALAIGYDTASLRLLKTVPSALMESAKMPAGAGKLIDYVFEVIAAEPGITEVSLTSAAVYDINGNAVAPVMPTANAVVTISASANPPYALGDMDGDGVIDEDDLRLLAKLKNGNGRKCTANQLKAGDFNGNGKLDNADYQALRALLVEKGVL